MDFKEEFIVGEVDLSYGKEPKVIRVTKKRNLLGTFVDVRLFKSSDGDFGHLRPTPMGVFFNEGHAEIIARMICKEVFDGTAEERQGREVTTNHQGNDTPRRVDGREGEAGRPSPEHAHGGFTAPLAESKRRKSSIRDDGPVAGVDFGRSETPIMHELTLDKNLVDEVRKELGVQKIGPLCVLLLKEWTEK